MPYSSDVAATKDLTEKIAEIRRAVSQVIVGQDDVVHNLIISILCNGHSLLVGVPGLAKTLLVKTVADVLDLSFKRIQFTPDLMPSDITGAEILNEQRQFQFLKGPVFANIVLADEINRTPPKTQAALLEAMQERNITVGGHMYHLPSPFFVLATQNPIEQEGTYELPEAQVDRFMLKVVITYPTKEDERKIIDSNIRPQGMPVPTAVLKPADIVKARSVVRDVYMDEKIEKYIVDIVFASRFPKEYKLQKFEGLISYGGSPRASINLALAAKAYAFIKRRGYVIPEDVRAVCLDVMRHRVGLTYEAEAENITSENIITEILNTVEVP
jgi:MoxR-like ATPase